MRTVRGLAPAVAVALAGLVLVLAGPRPGLLPQLLRHPQGAVDQLGSTAVVLVLAGVLGWLVLGWLCLGLLLVLLGRLPGAVGAAARCVADLALPAAVRRGVAVLLGLSLVSGAGAAAAAAGNPVRPAVRGPVASLNLDWPTTPQHPSSAHPRTPSGPRTVVVQRGDTLWALAARALGGSPTDAQIAAEWPRWYATNRGVIGADADLLRPGQLLRAPDSTHRPVPTSPTTPTRGTR